MPLHPVLLEKLNTAAGPASPPLATRRDASLPAVPGKVHAVIGMRRAGKTTFLRQLQAARREGLPPERAVFVSFDDDRLAEVGVDQLALLRGPDAGRPSALTFELRSPARRAGRAQSPARG
jgi:hypothetical protein